MNLTKALRELARDRRGAAAVELGLALPLLALVLLGGIDLGRFGYAAITVANAARVGAAYCDYASCTLNAETVTAIKDRVLHEVCPPETCPPGVPPLVLDPANITVSSQAYAVTAPHCPCLLVRVQYLFSTVTPWPGLPTSFWTGHQAMLPMGVQGS